MTKKADNDFVEGCLANFYSQATMFHVAKEPPFDVEDGGVPPAMFDGEIDTYGWVRWKMLPSTLTEEAVLNVEKMLPGPFPPLFRAFLTAKFMMGIETRKVRLPALPSDNPLRDLLLELRGWSVLFPASFIALPKTETMQDRCALILKIV